MNPLLGDALPVPASVFRVSRWEFLLLVVTAVLIACKNFILIVDGLGEPDAARLMNDAIIWHHTGSLPFSEYRATTSPGYLAILKCLIDAGIAHERIIGILNSVNAVVGAILISLSFFFFRLFLSSTTSFACMIALSFVPCVSVFSLYGFPSLLAYFALCLSVLLFVQSIVSSSPSALLVFSSAVALSIGTILKADMILLAGGYLGMLVVFDRVSRHTLASAISIVAIGAIAPIAFKLLLLPDSASSVPKMVSFAQNWNERFPLTLSYFFSRTNIRIAVRSVGPVLAALGVLGTFSSVLKKDTRRMTWVMVLFTLPLVVFWGLRAGNSARHMLGVSIPVVTMAGLLLRPLNAWRFPRCAMAVATGAAIALNYFSISANGSTIAPSSRLVESALILRRDVSERMKYGEAITSSSANKHYLIDSYTIPYSLYNVIKDSRSIERWSNEFERGTGRTAVRATRESIVGSRNGGKVSPYSNALDVVLPGGRRLSLAWKDVGSLEHATALADQVRTSGYAVWSVQYPGI